MAQQHQQGHSHQEHHVIPFPVLRNVAVALLALTALTVLASRLHLGAMEAPVAFLIAFVKAMLVMAFFMGLKYDTKLNKVIFASGFFFLALLFFFTALDIWTRVGQSSNL